MEREKVQEHERDGEKREGKERRKRDKERERKNLMDKKGNEIFCWNEKSNDRTNPQKSEKREGEERK